MSLEGRVGLDASSYINNVEQMTRSLVGYTRAAEAADSATRTFAKSDAGFAKMSRDLGVAKAQLDALKRGAVELRNTVDVFKTLDIALFNKDGSARSILQVNQAANQLGLTLKQLEELQGKLNSGWNKLSGPERVIYRQKEAFNELNKGLDNLSTAGEHAFNKLSEKYGSFAKKMGNGEVIERLKTLKGELSKVERDTADALENARKVKGAGSVGLQADAVTAAEKKRVAIQAEITALEKQLETEIAATQKKLADAVATNVKSYVTRQIGKTFDDVDDTVKIRIQRLKNNLLAAVQLEGGATTLSKTRSAMTSGSIEKQVAARDASPKTYAAMEALDRAIAEEKARKEEARAAGIRRTISSGRDRSLAADPNARMEAVRAELTFRNALANAVQITPGMTEAEAKVKQAQILLRLEKDLKGVASENVDLARAYVNYLKMSAKEKEQATREHLADRTKANQMALSMTSSKAPWLEAYRSTQIEIPKGITAEEEEAYTTARGHLAITKAMAFSAQQAAYKRTIGIVAADAAKAGINQDKAGLMMKEMLGPETNTALRVEMLQKMPTAYKALVDLAQLRARLERSIAQDLKEQKKIAESGISAGRDDVRKAAIAKRLETLTDPKGVNLASILQQEFEQIHGNVKLSGMGRVEAQLAAKKVIESYAQSTGLNTEDFIKNTTAFARGDSDTISKMTQMYPNLAKEMTNYNNAIKHGERESKTFVSHWDNFQRLILARGITWAFYNMTQQIEQAVAAAAELYVNIAEIQTISKDANISVDAWADAIRRVSDEYRMTQADVAESIYQLTSNQVAYGQGALSLMEQLAPFAKVTKATLTDSVNIISSALNSYNIDASNASIIMAQLFKVVELGRVRVADMANSFGRASSMAIQMGMSIEELNAMIAHLTIAGVKYERASTYIINILNSLIKPSEPMKAFFESLGVSSGEAAIKIYGFIGVMQKFVEYTHGMSGATADLVKNMRAIIGFGATTRDLDQLRKYEEAMKHAASDYMKGIELVYEGPGDRLNGILNKFKNEFIGAAQTLIQDIILALDTQLTSVTKGSINLSSLAKGVIPLGVAGLIAQTSAVIAAIKPDAKFAGILKAHGGKAGLVAGGALLAQAIYASNQRRKFDESMSLISPDKRERLIKMEEEYHKQKDVIEKTETEWTRSYESQLIVLDDHIKKRNALWEDHFKVLEKGPQRMQEFSNEAASFFEDMLKRQQDMFTGSAGNPIEETLRRMAVGQDLLSRIGKYGTADDPDKHTSDQVKRFMSYGKDTLRFLDTQIGDIQKSGFSSDTTPFYELFIMQRDQMTAAMMQVVQQTTGMNISGDIYENLYSAKTLEQGWQTYFQEFTDLKTKIITALDQGVNDWDKMVQFLASVTNYRQEVMLTDMANDPIVRAKFEAEANKAVFMTKYQAKKDEFKNAFRNIGSDVTLSQMRPFEDLYKVAMALGLNEQLQRGNLVKSMYEGNSGIIPMEKQQEFARLLADFMDSFKTVYEKYKTFDTQRWIPNAESVAVRVLMETYDPASGDRLRHPERVEDLKSLVGLSEGMATGGAVMTGPRGTDTVPAWLTPGEFIVSKDAAAKHAPLLEKINAGYYALGGSVYTSAGRSDRYGEQQMQYSPMFTGAGRINREGSSYYNDYTWGGGTGGMEINGTYIPFSHGYKHGAGYGRISMEGNRSFYRETEEERKLIEWRKIATSINLQRHLGRNVGFENPTGNRRGTKFAQMSMIRDGNWYDAKNRLSTPEFTQGLEDEDKLRNWKMIARSMNMQNKMSQMLEREDIKKANMKARREQNKALLDEQIANGYDRSYMLGGKYPMPPEGSDALRVFGWRLQDRNRARRDRMYQIRRQAAWDTRGEAAVSLATIGAGLAMPAILPGIIYGMGFDSVINFMSGDRSTEAGRMKQRTSMVTSAGFGAALGGIGHGYKALKGIQAASPMVAPAVFKSGVDDLAVGAGNNFAIDHAVWAETMKAQRFAARATRASSIPYISPKVDYKPVKGLYERAFPYRSQLLVGPKYTGQAYSDSALRVFSPFETEAARYSGGRYLSHSQRDFLNYARMKSSNRIAALHTPAQRRLSESVFNTFQNADGMGLPFFRMPYANGGFVNRPRGSFSFNGRTNGVTTNNYSTTANITLQSSGNEALDARRLMDNINRESHRGTRRLANVS